MSLRGRRRASVRSGALAARRKPPIDDQSRIESSALPEGQPTAIDVSDCRRANATLPGSRHPVALRRNLFRLLLICAVGRIPPLRRAPLPWLVARRIAALADLTGRDRNPLVRSIRAVGAWFIGHSDHTRTSSTPASVILTTKQNARIRGSNPWRVVVVRGISGCFAQTDCQRTVTDVCHVDDRL